MSRTRRDFLAGAMRHFPNEDVQDAIPCSSGLYPAFSVFLPLELLTREYVLAVTSKEYILARRGRSGMSLDVESRTARTPLSYHRGSLYAKLRVAGRTLWVHRRFWSSLDSLAEPHDDGA